MKKILIINLVVLFCVAANFRAQIPAKTLISIVRAEDESRFDETLEALMKSGDAKTRARAALAAGRIGDDRAVTILTTLLEADRAAEVRATAAFALGEIESTKAADAILRVLSDASQTDAVRARAVEAAGKIAAANQNNEKSKLLGEAILDVLEAEDRRAARQNRETVLLALTAALRARPEETDFTVAKFLTNMDARIRADAANVLSRVRAKNANEPLRAMLLTDADAVARANAARALGAAEDKESFNVLLEAAATDDDARVRVSAIRSLGNLKDARAADKLLARGEKLLADHKKSKSTNPSEKSELLEIAAVVGRLLPNTNDKKAVDFLMDFGLSDRFASPEIHVAFAKIAPDRFLAIEPPGDICSASAVSTACWRFQSAYTLGLSELAALEKTNSSRANAENSLLDRLKSDEKSENAKNFDARSVSDKLRAFAAFKTPNSNDVFIGFLNYKDVIVRATAAELLGDSETTSRENVAALIDAFAKTKTDRLNDAALSTLGALEKQYQKLPKSDASATAILQTFQTALESPDYLVRRRTAAILKNLKLADNVPQTFERVRFPLKNNAPGEFRTVRADYARAVARKNGTVKAILTTEKGSFAIEFFPEDAPLAVDNFVRLAKSNYFNGLAVHRVVPNFVMQDGDPRGDGNGGPGWQIRCEINMKEYERGAVGMALSGKDTGGSQWFVTHSPQPHLDGGYTVFGRVNETDMKIVDQIVRGDKILKVQIVEANAPRKGGKGNRK